MDRRDAHNCGVHCREEREKQDVRRPAVREARDCRDQPPDRLEVDSEQDEVDSLDRERTEQLVRRGDQGGERGRRVPGVGQPVLVQIAHAGVREAVEEVLVLVRVVERGLGVGDGLAIFDYRTIEHLSLSEGELARVGERMRFV